MAALCMDLMQEYSRPETYTSLKNVLNSMDDAVEEISKVALTRGQMEVTMAGQDARAPYQLLLAPEGCSAEDASKYEARQLRCFAADWLTREGGPKFAKLDQDRRAWSFLLQR